MKIYVTGDVIHLERISEINHVKLARVVGLIELGQNNGDNNFGWSGLKAVVNFNDLLYVLDFPEEAKITTEDNVLVKEGGNTWHPSLEDINKFDLFLFNKDDY